MKYFFSGLIIVALAFVAFVSLGGQNESGIALPSIQQRTSPRVVGVEKAAPKQPFQPSSAQNQQEPNPSTDLAPGFTAQTLSGQLISLASYVGEKPVVLDFFATWCHNCQRAMPELSRWYEKYGDDIEVIGVNLRENQSTIKGFIDSKGISFPIALDPSGSISSSYGVRYTNTHVLIARDGSVVKTIPGDLRESDIVSLLN